MSWRMTSSRSTPIPSAAPVLLVASLRSRPGWQRPGFSPRLVEVRLSEQFVVLFRHARCLEQVARMALQRLGPTAFELHVGVKQLVVVFDARLLGCRLRLVVRR